MSCAVAGCVNNRRFRPEGVSFHTFPRHDLVKAWLNILGKDAEKWTWSRNKVVCSLHFRNEDFLITGGRRTLKFNAVPFVVSPGEKCQRLSSQTMKCFIDESQAPISQARESSVDQSKSLLSLDDESNKQDNPLKRELSETEELKNSTGTDCNIKRKRITEFVKTIHSYSVSPQKLKSENLKLRVQQGRCRRKLYTANKKIAALRKEVTSLKGEVLNLKKQISYLMMQPTFKKEL